MRHPRAWQRKPRPRAALGKPPRGTKTAGSVRLAVNAKAERCRVARREDADARVMGVQGPGVPGPPVKNRAGLAKSRPCAFSARHSPRGGRKRDGQTPSPTKPGADETRLFDNRICLSPFAPAEAGAQESKLPLERVGPRFRGDERWRGPIRRSSFPRPGAPSPYGTLPHTCATV